MMRNSRSIFSFGLRRTNVEAISRSAANLDVNELSFYDDE